MDNKQELASNAEKGIRTKLHRKSTGRKGGIGELSISTAGNK
jgi:hypothetical protein